MVSVNFLAAAATTTTTTAIATTTTTTTATYANEGVRCFFGFLQNGSRHSHFYNLVLFKMHVVTTFIKSYLNLTSTAAVSRQVCDLENESSESFPWCATIKFVK